MSGSAGAGSGAATRHSRRRAAGPALVAVLMTGCLAPVPTPTASRPASASASPAIPPSARPADPSTATPSSRDGAGSPTPLPDEPEAIAAPLASFTVICEDWGTDAPADEVECEVAARLALAAIGGGRAAAVRRLDVAYGDPCGDAPTCPPRVASVRTIVARTADFETLVVRVARDADGRLRVWPPAEHRRLVPASFVPPQPVAPDLGPDAPIELRARQPVAFCGSENLTGVDAFDSGARQCFLDGVTAWIPVELILTDRTTDDGDPVTTVLRFTGRGAIQRYVRSRGSWTATDCALSPIGTNAVFVVTSPCDRRDLRP